MSVREIENQVAEHDSGAIVRNAGPETMKVDYLGRTLTLDVDRHMRTNVFYIPESMNWDDGSPVPPEMLERIERIIDEVGRFWGIKSEFQRDGG